MATFEVLPAIDLRGGRVVRLRQGDFGRETAYSDDAVAIARQFVAAGATWLHVVDLDGARGGQPAHLDLVRRIVDAVGDQAYLDVAGGLRSTAAVQEVLGAGAARAVVGTAALERPEFVAHLVDSHGSDRIAVALDVRDGSAVGNGWVPGSRSIPVDEVVDTLADHGVRWFEVTAIDRDGTLGGPDLELLSRVTLTARASVIAAGGIRSADDIRAVRAIGCRGAIVGRALYDGTLAAEAALAAATE